MAKKTFGELKGVQLSKYNKDGELVGDVVCRDKENDDFTYRIIYHGDPLFVVDVYSMTVRMCVVKFIQQRYYNSSSVTIGYCDKANNTKLMPTKDELLGYKRLCDIETVQLPTSKSQCSIYATTLADALLTLNRLREHNAFMFAKKGDNLFVTNRDSNTVEKLTIQSIISLRNNENPYNDKIHIELSDNSVVQMRLSKYCSKTSVYADYDFVLRMKGKYVDYSRYFVYTTEKEAVSDLKSMIKRRANAKKKIKKEFEKGSEIKLKDSKQNVLHVGDTVAYVRNSGQASLMAVGVIVKETKAQIQIFDEEEKERVRELRKERNKRYTDNRYFHEEKVEQEDDGYHYVTSGRLLLIQEFKKRK